MKDKFSNFLSYFRRIISDFDFLIYLFIGIFLLYLFEDSGWEDIGLVFLLVSGISFARFIQNHFKLHLSRFLVFVIRFLFAIWTAVLIVVVLVFMRSGRFLPFEIVKERFSKQEYLTTFPERNDTSQKDSTPDNIISAVLSEFEKNPEHVFCDYKKESIKYEITDFEGYSDISKSFDLNKDGVDEYLVFPIEVCGYVIRGASGNGTIYVFEKKDNQWVIIGELIGNSLRIKNRISNGYYDIETNYHMSANSGYTYTYKFEETSGSYSKVSESSYSSYEDVKR